MASNERPITAATDQLICEFIQEAENRLVVLVPEVSRLGYGDFESLSRLEATAAELGAMVQRQPGIRIGLIVSDTRTLVYTPTPALIEAGPSTAYGNVVLRSVKPEFERKVEQRQRCARDGRKTTSTFLQSRSDDI